MNALTTVRLAALTGALSVAAALTSAAQVDPMQPTIPEALVLELDDASAVRMNGDLDGAITQLQAIIQARPDFYNALLNLGVAQFARRQISESLETFERALQVRKAEGIEDYHVFNTVGWIHLESGDFDNAERYLRIAVENAGKNSTRINRVAFNNLGLLYLYRNRLEEAERYFELAAERYGNASAARNLRLVAIAREDQEKLASKTLGAGRWALLKKHVI